MSDSIKPGQVWLDTAGNRIQAHGGSIAGDDTDGFQQLTLAASDKISWAGGFGLHA